MTGMNASVSAGWYTFTNLGPVTTTFTPAPSCTASDRVLLGYLNPTGNNLYLAYATEPTSTPDFKGCTPTPSPTTTDSVESSVHITSDEQMSAFMAHRIDWRGFGAYYSPGLHCPSGWETMGTAARDASSSLSSSGVFVPTKASTSTQSYSTDDMYYYMFNYEDPASVLKDLLEPKETMVACCPRYVPHLC